MKTCLDSKTDKTQGNVRNCFKPSIRLDIFFEQLRQFYGISNMLLQSFHSINTHDEPQF